jgi:flagellar biosynthesis protein FlhB
MAEADGQEKTEQASGKKLSESRNKGQVARSTEINSFAIFMSGLVLLLMTQKHLGNNVANLAKSIFGHLDKLSVNQDVFGQYLISGLSFFFNTMGPIFLGLVIVSIVAGYAQVGFKITPSVLAPKFSKLNIISNIKSKFFSTHSLFELGKSLLKLGIIGFFTYWVLKDVVVSAISIVEFSVEEIFSFMIDSAYNLLWKLALVYAIIAVADFAYQKYKFRNDMMMTKHEVKEENKQTEGDPHVKGRIRSIQMSLARSRMMKELPTADVVITNPTHFAVALKYDFGKTGAPKVIAKGVDDLAQRIKKIAVEHNIPLHEDRELARALYKLCDIGDEIPQNLFKTVAQILAYIYKLKNQKKKKTII